MLRLRPLKGSLMKTPMTYSYKIQNSKKDKPLAQRWVRLERTHRIQMKRIVLRLITIKAHPILLNSSHIVIL